MSAYVIMIRERINDPDSMAAYSKLAQLARTEGPPTPLAFYGPKETWEGPEADGIVILQFADMAAARQWYNSPAYQAALPHRLRGADYRVLLVDGVSI